MVSSKLINRAEFAALAGVSSASITNACKSILAAAVVGKRINANHPDAVKYVQAKQPDEIMATGFDPLFEEAVEMCRSTGRYSLRGVKEGLKVGTARGQKIVALLKAAGVIPEPGELPPIIEPAPKTQRTIKGHTAKNNTKKAESLANLLEDKKVHEIPENISSFADKTLRELIEQFGTEMAFLDWLKAIKEIENIETKRLKNAAAAGKLINRELVCIGMIEPINTAHIQLLTDGAKTLALKITTMVKAGEEIPAIEKSVVDQMSSFIRPVKDKIAKALRKA